LVHTLVAIESAYVPVLQSVHADAPAIDQTPSGHGRQVELLDAPRAAE
jgi:hypothetical protein